MKKRIILFLLIFLMDYAFAEADSIHSFGNTVNILDNEDVQMVEQVIKMNVFEDQNENKDNLKMEFYTDVEVVYTFKNTSSKRLSIKMAFPERFGSSLEDDYDYSEELTDIEARDYQLLDFQAFDNRQNLNVLFQDSQEANTNNVNWYIFSVDFAPNQTKQIRNTYSFKNSAYNFGANWFYYILKTGDTQNEHIEKIDIFINFQGDLLIYDLEYDVIKLAGFIINEKNNSLEWHLVDFQPTADDYLYVQYQYPSFGIFDDILHDGAYDDFFINNSSSFLSNNSSEIYYHNRAFDNDLNTAWAEGVEGAGIDEWINLKLYNSNRVCNKVKVFTGFGDSKSNWSLHNRVKKLNITSGDYSHIVKIEDIFGYQVVPLPEALYADNNKIKLTIADIYPGSKYDHTALADIKFLCLPNDIPVINVVLPFRDIVNHRYQKAIEDIYERDIVEGYADQTYRPDETINRAEFTKIIVEAFLKENSGNANCFTDVIQGKWYSEYVCTALEFELIGGYPDGTFRPNQDISYVEAAKIIVNALAIDVEILENDFWYQPYIDILEAKNAKPVTVSMNNQKITRGEMAQIIYRIIK